jgi:hypothetical protein
MKNIINIFTQPSTVFISVKEKPEWSKPLTILLVVLTILSILSILTTRDLINARQIEAMKARNMTDEQIEQAMKFASGPMIVIFGAIGTIIGTLLILLIFAGILNLLIPVFGGSGDFRTVFTVVTYAGLVKIPGQLLRWILIMLKHSLKVSTSLALFLPVLEPNSFAYRFLNGIDFFIIWEIILVATGISITNNLKKQNAYILVFALWVLSVFLGAGLEGSFRGR